MRFESVREYRINEIPSSVSIVPDYRLEDRATVVPSPAEAKVFPLVSVSKPVVRPTHPPIHWPFPWSKSRPGRDADH
jgi:hypothetical protein